MPNRRSFLVSLVSGAVFAAGLARVGWARQPAVRRHGRFYIVNGWVLTAEDVRALSDRAL